MYILTTLQNSIYSTNIITHYKYKLLKSRAKYILSEVISISPADSYQRIQDDPRSLLIDVRSSMEFLFVGHPTGAIHIPWIDEPDWNINPDFTVEVRKRLLGGVHGNSGSASEQGGAPIILVCRSGKRSVEAGKRLLADGFKQVFSINEGFEGELNSKHQRSSIGGWRFRGLPWEQC
ncbi:MAG: rhodanese-like domain-containing protein [Thiotrichales bacterium]|nr:rhodanese-like domain-containing protein [Thiotrichales bacterium]MBT3613160.1 rhodanese-like domain-containing protein [Thiotrichales bacterium]MBT3752306.1 rhodanese-like domain-containing protein [Thiotrichales bacterium]MBT3837707.1 rhodanese-like domain-containing protein [Thiotrichales bacterium]MBT4152872.1 rhodanese-like domain-containing protein [Thiotrichales bacterium]